MVVSSWHDDVVAELSSARRELLEVVDRLDARALAGRAADFLSPIVWDLAHVALYEEYWLHVRAAGREPRHRELWPLYDAQEQPRGVRGSLPLLDLPACLALLAETRDRTLSLLGRIAGDGTRPLLSDGFVFRMVARHEDQHRETVLQSLALRDEDAPLPGFEPPAPSAGNRAAEQVLVPGGPSALGTDDASFAWDNERPQHVVVLPAFAIDDRPATCARFAEFVDDGGYVRRELWSAAGWSWRTKERIDLPLGWRREGTGFSITRFGHTAPLDAYRPVERISWHEAEAFARWCGGRLPTEAEWEKAARSGAIGTEGVYEWTSSEFGPYPGFEAFPYPEYSAVHFHRGYRVLRGASWCIGPRVARRTYRNWDWPHRRQVFAGVRVARDVI